MTPRRLTAAALLALVCLGWPIWPEHVGAAELTVESETVGDDFPTGLTLDLDFATERTIVRAYVLYTLAHEDISSEVAATLAADGSSAATAVIDMETAYVPAGVDVTYRWRLIAEDDSEVATQPATIIWQDDRFDWERSASDDVEVFGYEGGGDLRGEVLNSAQETVDRLSEEFGVDVEHPLRIWIYASKKDFDGTLAANSQEWAAGAAYPDLQLILAVIPPDRPSELGRIIPHEVSHQLLALATDNPYNAPATWLDEGFAVSNQTNGSSHMARLVATAKREGRLLPLTSLDTAFPFDPTDAGLAYAESFSVVTYLVDTYGDAAVAAIAAAYRTGSTHDDAVRAGTGRDIAQLDREWRATIDDDAASSLDGDDVARLLIYGVPALGVITALALWRFRPHTSYPEDDEAAA